MTTQIQACEIIDNLMRHDGFHTIERGSLDWSPLINYINHLRADAVAMKPAPLDLGIKSSNAIKAMTGR